MLASERPLGGTLTAYNNALFEVLVSDMLVVKKGGIPSLDYY